MLSRCNCSHFCVHDFRVKRRKVVTGMLFTEFDRKSVRGNATLNTLTAWVDAVKMVLTFMLSLIFVSLIQFSFLFPLE